MKSNSLADVRCYRCLEKGHHQSDCTNELVCYKCKQKGHMAVDCRFTKKLKLCSFGIPSQGFYAMEILEAKIKVNQATSFIIVLQGEATKDKISKELKNLVRSDWDFRVKKSHHQEYMVIFPDKATLVIFSKLSEFEMPLYGLKG